MTRPTTPTYAPGPTPNTVLTAEPVGFLFSP